MEVPCSTVRFLERDTPQLAVGCVNFGFYVFEVAERSLSAWSEDGGVPVSASLPIELSQRNDFPVRIGLNPADPSKLILVR